MAKFHSSKVIDLPNPSANLDDMPNPMQDLPIGEILKERLNLTDDQVTEIVNFSKERDLRFGDSAVALGLASTDDVLHALAQQFDYQYAPQDKQKVSPELVALTQPFSFQAESFRAIRSQVMMRAYANGEPRRAIAVVSPNSGDGKTYFSANLAVALAQLGGRTLIVDADLRGARLHDIFQVDNRTGLSSLLVGRADSRIIQQVKSVRGLYVLPVGVSPPNPQELIERPTFGILLRELAARFDHVIVDTPAVVFGADAQVIADRCGAVLLVARKDESRVAALQGLVKSLSQSQARMVGVIMNEF